MTETKRERGNEVPAVVADPKHPGHGKALVHAKQDRKVQTALYRAMRRKTPRR